MGARTLDTGRLGLAVERCYEAVILPDLWPSVFQEFAEAANATGMIGFQFGADTQKNLLLCSPSLDESTDAYVREGWFLRNPRIVRASRVASPDRLVSDQDLALVRDTLDDADRAWRHDFLQRQGLGWFAGTDFFFNGGMNRVGISVERSIKVEPFQSGELAIIYRALAQVRRALALAPALDDAAANGLLNGLESSGHAAGTAGPIRSRHTAQRTSRKTAWEGIPVARRIPCRDWGRGAGTAPTFYHHPRAVGPPMRR